MPRLIDAGALIAEMHNVILEDGEDRRVIYEVIERQPTIAQPEIVRCRDCCYWIPGLITDNDCFIPPKCGKYQRGKYQQMVGHSADDYCSYAERREVSE
jgi:hypothetical protein